MPNDREVVTRTPSGGLTVIRQALELAQKPIEVSTRWATKGYAAISHMVETSEPLSPPRVNLERLDELGAPMRALEAILFSLSSLLYATDFTRRGWMFQLRFVFCFLFWIALPFIALVGVFLGGWWCLSALSTLLAKVAVGLLWGILIILLIAIIRALVKVIPSLLKLL